MKKKHRANNKRGSKMSTQPLTTTNTDEPVKDEEKEESNISLTEALQKEEHILTSPLTLPDEEGENKLTPFTPMDAEDADMEDTFPFTDEEDTPLPNPEDILLTLPDAEDTPLPNTNDTPSSFIKAYKFTEKGIKRIRPPYKWKISYFVEMERRQGFRPGEITVYSEEAFENAYLALIRAALTTGEVAVIICEDDHFNTIKLTITKENIKAFNSITEDSLNKRFELIVGDKTLVLRVSDLLEKRPLTLLNLTPDSVFQNLKNSVEEIVLRESHTPVQTHLTA